MVYLDRAATTPVDARVIEAMNRCMTAAWANPSAAYSVAGEARRTLRMARRAVAGLLGEDAERLPGLVALLLPGLASEEAVARLNLMGVAVSGGAACASGERAVGHVYRAMGLTETEAKSVLRVSVGRATTADDLRAAAEGIGAILGRAI